MDVLCLFWLMFRNVNVNMQTYPNPDYFIGSRKQNYFVLKLIFVMKLDSFFLLIFNVVVHLYVKGMHITGICLLCF